MSTIEQDRTATLRELIRDMVMVFEELREGHDFEMQSRLLISIERLLQRAEAL